MIELEAALEQILTVLPVPAAERVPLNQALGRILGADTASPASLPRFDNSAMDGYAVCSADFQEAGPDRPVRLERVGRVAAGDRLDREVRSGECVRIFTGSPLPAGADAVIMQEDTRVPDDDADAVDCLDCVRPWENVRMKGEDIREGERIAGAGEPVSAGLLSLLAATGVGEVEVFARPVVGLLATGSELREPGESLKPGEIHESNRAALAPLIAEAGGTPRVFPLVGDDLAATTRALQEAFGECDLVVTTGGASVGEMDFVKEAFEEMGGTLGFWKVRVKPGKPFVFGSLGDKRLFGLPGNPVSAWVTFLLLVRPAIRRWQGARESSLPGVWGELSEPLANRGNRRHFFRVELTPDGTVRSPGLQASHALKSLARANGLVDVPPETTLEEGARVRVLMWGV